MGYGLDLAGPGGLPIAETGVVVTEGNAPVTEESEGLHLSRRRALAGAAWSVPAITLATAAPAFAGSPAPGATPQTYLQDFNTIGTGTFGAGALAGWGLYVAAGSSSIGTSYLSNQLGSTSAGGASPTPFKTAQSWAAGSGGIFNMASPKAPLTSGSNTATQAAAADRALGLQQNGWGSFDPGMAVVYDFSGQSGTLALKGDVTVSVTLTVVNPQNRGTTWTLQYGTSDTSWTTLDSYTVPEAGPAFGAGKTLTGLVPNILTGSIKFRVVALTISTATGSRDGITLDDFTVTWLE